MRLLGSSGRKKPVLGGQESWGDAAMAVMSVVEALPFCHHNICFNILCFFPDWNHLNCICRGLYRLINIVTPLRALVFCGSTARVKESAQQTFGPSFCYRGSFFPSWQWVGTVLHERVMQEQCWCLGSCEHVAEHEVTPKSQISLYLPPDLWCPAFSCTA